MYTYENGKWLFHRDGDVIESDSISVIFEQAEPFDFFLKHGQSEEIEELFLSEAYDILAKNGFNFIMVKVPPSSCETLNKCLSISASKWCNKLLEESGTIWW